jgi:hypothetical protein
MNPPGLTAVPPAVSALSLMPLLVARLKNSSSEFHDEAFEGAVDKGIRAETLSMDILTSGGRAIEPKPLLVSQIALTVRVIGNGRKVATLRGEWQLGFLAPSAEALEAIDDDLAVAFNTYFAPRIAWPFAREFFVNLCWRMQIPPAMLPPFDPAIFPDFLKAGQAAAARHIASLAAKAAK